MLRTYNILFYCTLSFCFRDLNMEVIMVITFLMLTEIGHVSSVVPSPLPLLDENNRLELIKGYFYAGFKYAEIVLLLFCRHNIRIGLRQLKRLLRINNLRRRGLMYTPTEIIKETLRNELQFSAEGLGYRSMWKRLQNDFHFKVKRNDVMLLLREIDLDGVQLRKGHKLKRRKYLVPGPNFCWHIDGYDKLKQFGLCIHGAMDGYSRRVMWLEVASTNNNPRVIAKYYLDTVAAHKFVPRIVRADRGTENVNISFLQPFFRQTQQDSMAGLKSFMYGKSTTNQRIERWWGYLKQQCISWWINKLKDLRDLGRFDGSNPVHVECLRFCVSGVLQAELDRIAIHWNLHQVRQQKNTLAFTGKPDVLFNVPELFGSRNYGVPVNMEDVSICQELYAKPKEICSDTFSELAHILKPGLQMPLNAHNALDLYEELMHAYEQVQLELDTT